jgi:hypothetical protein
VPPNAFSTIHPEAVLPSPHFYLGADYLLWWVRRRPTPTVVTAGNINDPIPGAVGQANTRVLIGGSGADDDNNQSGGRLTAVYWFDQDHTCGVDGSFFILEQSSTTRTAGGDGSDPTLVIARPFFDPNSGVRVAAPIVVPRLLAGEVAVSTPRRFMGGDANLRFSEEVSGVVISRVTLLAGARYAALDEKLLVAEDVTGVPGFFRDGSLRFSAQDNFVTYDRFYGGQLGLETETRVGPVLLTTVGKVALGTTEQIVKNTAFSQLTTPRGVTTDLTRGLLIQPTNRGRFSRNEFGALPEVDFSVTWVFNEHLRASLGYSFLYWSNVVRPGDQVDPTVNVGGVGALRQPGTSPHPLEPFHTTGFWAQGLSAGLEVSF